MPVPSRPGADGASAAAISARLLDLIADTLPPTDSATIATAYRRLSGRYLAGMPTAARLGPAEVVAYATARLPATAAATAAVLVDLGQLLPDWAPRSALDLGAGLGSAGWMAAAIFPTLSDITFVERAAEMVRWGQPLATRSPLEAVVNGEWLVGDATEPADTADLIIASYVLGELSGPRREIAVESWWASTTGCLVIVEPGTPAGYRRVLSARDHLIAMGATIAAPCPGEAPCPLRAGDWCHFAARVARRPAHRAAKSGALGYEDEKYSYVVATSIPAVRQARVIRPPRRRGGHVLLDLCTKTGVLEIVSSRADVDAWRRARRLRWADRVCLEDLDGE